MLPPLDVEIGQLVTSSVLECAPDTPIAAAARSMADHHASAIVVTDAGRAVGIWTERDALAIGDDVLATAGPIESVMSRPVVSLDERTPLADAVAQVKARQIRHCVVTGEAGQTLGVLTQTDIVMNHGAEFFLRMKSIASAQPAPPIIFDETRALRDAMQTMRAQRASAIVVAYADRSYGILTEHDVVRLVAAGTLGGCVGEYASRPLITMRGTQTLLAARQTLSRRRLRHLGVLDANGTLAGLLSLRDILRSIEYDYVHELQSALRERDAALDASRHHLRLTERVFDSVLDGVMITDRDGNIERVNPAFTRLTGYQQSEVAGMNARLLSARRQPEAFYREMWQSLIETGQWQGEIWNRRKDGEPYLAYLSIRAIGDDTQRFSHYAATFSDITQRRLTEERLNHLAMHDALTGLPNRTLFSERLDQSLARARRAARQVAVMFIDLDRFKVINDTLGHSIADDALKAVAVRLSEAVRETDTVARIGGDEFAIVLEQIESIRDVGQIVQSLLALVAQPIIVRGHAVFITPSVGISMYPDDGTDPRQLLMQADRAMYEAKDAGKNTFRFFAPHMTSTAMERIGLEAELCDALARGEFRLRYQPEYDLQSGEITSIEALIEWQHPSRGTLSAGHFIGIAEESALIVPIGAWVLREACTQARAWLGEGRAFGRIAVNLSGRQCLHDGFLQELAAILGETGLPAERLQLELVESMLMTGSRTIEALLRELATRGISLAIDDFGTGYSSFSYLQRLPIDLLKIDKSFLVDLEPTGRGGAILRAIVAMAKALGTRVVAEGVETREQMAFLQEIGCERAQGYWLARPQPPHAVLFGAPPGAPLFSRAPSRALEAQSTPDVQSAQALLPAQAPHPARHAHIEVQAS